MSRESFTMNRGWKTGQLNGLRELVRYRDLLYMLAWRDICIKYKQSILGLMWAILMPAVIVLAGIVVKLAFAMVSDQPAAASGIASVAIKAVPWAFFVSAIRFSTNSLIGNSNLVTKIYFPKVILPIAAVLSQLFDFLIASCVLVVFLAFWGLQASLTILWIPVLILLMVMLATGLGIFLSAAGLFFRDVKYIVEILLTFAIFFTPVFYEVSMFKDWGTVLLLNPVAPILEGLTAAVVDQGAPNLAWIAYSLVVSLVILAGAVAFFRKVEPAFAEYI